MPLKVISGGQAGVDRLALDVAMELGLEVGGWCPYGRRAEDGRIPERYPLKETLESPYQYRTRKNVEEADHTILIYVAPLRGGSHFTLQCAKSARSPIWLIPIQNLLMPDDYRAQTLADLNGPLARVQVVNFAGTRGSRLTPYQIEAVRQFIQDALKPHAPQA